MLIQLTNQKALKLLHDLEDLKLIKVLKENITVNTKLSDKYRGSVSKEEGKKFIKHIEASRNEWNNI